MSTFVNDAIGVTRDVGDVYNYIHFLFAVIFGAIIIIIGIFYLDAGKIGLMYSMLIILVGIAVIYGSWLWFSFVKSNAVAQSVTGAMDIGNLIR